MPQAASIPQIFISYSHEDEHWLEAFQKMLKSYVRRGEFKVWADTRISPSAEWRLEIKGAIEKSKAALLLVSPSYLASDFIAEVELPAIFKRLEAGYFALLWVLVSSCAFRGTGIERFQAVHNPKYPLERLNSADRNSALTEICEKVKRALFPLRQSILPVEEADVLPDKTEVAEKQPAVLAPSEAARPLPPDKGTADLEYQMLFGALAAQMDLISPAQLTEALVSWSGNRSLSIAEHMMEGRWLEAEDKAAIDRLLDRKLKKYRGDVPSTLAAIADSTLRDAMRSSGIADVSHSLDALMDEEATDQSERIAGIPRYEWVRLHRDGRLGEVWLGHDGDLDRDVALKIISPERASDPRAQRRFLREAQITAKLEHPNIVPVHELGQRPGDQQPFYAMRFLRGKTMSEVIAEYHHNRREGRFDAQERRRLLGMFLNVCNAVAYSHSRHILHRDLKPDNVVLGDFGEVYLLDWGLAKESPPTESMSTPDEVSAASLQFVPGTRGPGSPAYMSPEQAANRSDLIDIRTDVYGLGAILFEILAGKPPHGHGELNLDEALARILSEGTPSPRAFEGTVPPPLDEICKKAMAKKISDRYSSAKELAAAVQLFLDEEPLAVYRANVAWFEKAVTEHPKERSYREGLAKSLVNLGLVLNGMDRQADAEQVYRRAIAEYERLLADSPKVVRYRADLAACRLHLRSTLKAQGREADAENVHRDAIKDYEALIKENPSDREHRLRYASLLSVVGLSPEELQRKLEALPPVQEHSTADWTPEEVPSDDSAQDHLGNWMLFGILALQMDFISKEQLIAAMNGWLLDKSKSLGQILLEHNVLDPDQHALLEVLVKKQLAQHGNDLQQSLAAVDSIESVRQDVGQAVDPDAQASLSHLPEYATVAPLPWQEKTDFGEPIKEPRYRILRLQGKGGLGSVYVAYDEALHRHVALKEINERYGDDAEARARFLREAKITAGLEHPGVVPVYSLGQHADGRFFYAMRFIQGDSFQNAINRYHQREPKSRLSSGADETLEFRNLLFRFTEVCNVIQYAHARGVLHRDVKPGNIMLGKYGETLVLDWGLAKTIGIADSPTEEPSDESSIALTTSTPLDVTRMGSVLGTPAYMSPEQAVGSWDLVGPASDIFSLGATLYFLLTGRTPFEGAPLGEMLNKVRRGEFPPPRQVKKGVPRALEAICLKAMALRPENRYPAARALADDIERWLARESVSAYHEPWFRWLLRIFARK